MEFKYAKYQINPLVTPMDKTQQVRAAIIETCHKLGMGDLHEVIEIVWSNKMTHTAGTAVWKTKEKRGVIKLSNPLWEKTSSYKRLVTVITEPWHIIARLKYGPKVRHGFGWKTLMREMGLPPKVCHDIPTIYKPHKRKFKAYCSCGVHKITQNKMTRIRKGSKYTCNSCSDYIFLGVQ